MFYFGYGSYPVKVTHCKIGFLHMVRLYFLHLVRLYFLHLVRLYFLHLVRLYFLHLVRLTSYKQLFKTLTNSSRHAELFQYLIYIYVYIHLMFSCENISFVCVANSPTVHVNGYSFRFSFRKSAKKTIVVQDSYKQFPSC